MQCTSCGFANQTGMKWGVSAPIPVYRIVEEREARHPLEGTVQTGLTPLTGREQEWGPGFLLPQE